jgi:hypothetical protein
VAAEGASGFLGPLHLRASQERLLGSQDQMPPGAGGGIPDRKDRGEQFGLGRSSPLSLAFEEFEERGWHAAFQPSTLAFGRTASTWSRAASRSR